jgi:branched-chain amino acid transport system ATP-binding protein
VQTPHLQATNLRKEFAGLMAVYDVNFCVEPGEIVSLIGPNGAGKTTIFNMLSGVLLPTGGTICFEGHVLNGLKPHVINSLGVTRTFQSVQLLGSASRSSSRI